MKSPFKYPIQKAHLIFIHLLFTHITRALMPGKVLYFCLLLNPNFLSNPSSASSFPVLMLK